MNKQQQHEFQETTYKFTYRRIQKPKRYLPETFHQTRNGQSLFIFWLFSYWKIIWMNLRNGWFIQIYY